MSAPEPEPRFSSEYVEIFYNCQRRHSSLGYVSPMAYEREHRPSTGSG